MHHTSYYSEFFMIKKLVTVMIQNLFIVFLHLVLDVFFLFCVITSNNEFIFIDAF